jgi:hypothetical protein
MLALLPIFLTRRRSFWLQIQCQNLMSSGPAGRRPEEQACLGATRRNTSETSKTRVANSKRTGANTAHHSEASPMALSQPAARYVELLTCLEMAKQAKELPEDSKMGNPVGRC